MLGSVEAPELQEGMYLVDVLFRVGPVKHEAAVSEMDLEAWERRRGIELAPWQADIIVDMSKAYLAAMYAAREESSVSPWAPANGAWKYVCDERARTTKANKAEVDAAAAQMKGQHGNRQRR